MGARGFRTFLSLFLILFVLRLDSAHGQAGTSLAQLSGTVHDATGGYVAKAAVTLRETDTNRSYSTTSADNGFYAFANVAPGRYELRVAFQGFANFTQTGITLTVGQSASIDVTLKVATASEQVVVNTEAPVIEPRVVRMDAAHGAGISRGEQQFRGGIRPRGRRHCEHRYQIRQQRLSRFGLRVLPEQRHQCALYASAGASPVPVAAESIRRHAGRARKERQGFLFSQL